MNKRVNKKVKAFVLMYALMTVGLLAFNENGKFVYNIIGIAAWACLACLFNSKRFTDAIGPVSE
ncbi:MAG: hypothetical protein IJ551_08105 [Prevotella sp.]|nr:hypothetical protein [Prevotella sp.]